MSRQVCAVSGIRGSQTGRISGERKRTEPRRLHCGCEEAVQERGAAEKGRDVEMMHLGDICTINGAEAPVVDCVIGGSPCQDLSIAGKRAGLAGARSGLYMEQIRIIKEMREHDRESGRTGVFVRPRYMVWENVPGAFSSNGGRDFAAVLEEAIRIAEPEAPGIEVPEKGWPTWGGFRDVDGRWSVAWRVLDAQYWGVPQRRSRIALVADFGGTSAHEILFVRNSLPGDIEASGTAGKRHSASPEIGASCTVRTRGGCDGGGKGALVKMEKCGTLGTHNDQTLFCAGFKLGNSENARSIGYAEEQAPTLNAECGGNKPAILDMTHANDVIRECGEIVPTLQSRMGTGGNQVPLTYQQNGFGDYKESDNASSCKQRDYKDSTDLVVAVDCRNGTENANINGTLQAKSSGGMSLDLNNVCRIARTVRRLTPLECERLQGFQDGWTDIGEWTDENGKVHKESSDSARYKALGNSIALPPWKWVLKRLSAQYERDATMASLFDGLGGFPLIWEQLNGKGSCLWASEIEQFPIAVTKRRFGE